ncbi:MAG: hypothetical protein ACRC0J_16920, partial [Shewanella oncorhynchi]
MGIRFNGDFAELKNRLSPLGGEWDETQAEPKIMYLEGGILNWHETTGVILFQGLKKGKLL